MKLYGLVLQIGNLDDMVFAIVANSEEEAISKLKEKMMKDYGISYKVRNSDIYVEKEEAIDEVIYWHRSFD